MRILIYGAGDLAEAFRDSIYMQFGHEAVLVTKGECDVRDYRRVARHMAAQVSIDFVICTAGLSDRVIGATIQEVIDCNLTGPINVATAAAAFRLPCLLIASTAGMQAPEQHLWYGPAKAGVIAHVRASAKAGNRIWALSPNRMDTRMREADWPGEDKATRLRPRADVVPVIVDIIDGRYAPGANVVIRKVGTDGRKDIFEEGSWTLPSRLA